MDEYSQTEVFLKGQRAPVVLAEVTRADDEVIMGITPTGKRFATRKENTRGPIPDRHPFRVYNKGGQVAQVVDPAFEEVEAWFLGDSPGGLTIVLAHGGEMTIERDEVLSVLSAVAADEPTGDPEVDAEQSA